MRAIVFQQYGGPEVLKLEQRPDPQPKDGMVLISVRAFGLNRAETYMRSGKWGEVAKVSGIECVGEVVADPSGRLTPATRVAAMMGGMGRSIDGSYAELTLVPAGNVVPLQTSLSWADLAAIPETYATAWTCLHRNLEIAWGQVLLIRGATSALGQAALNIAVGDGVTVIAVTRRWDRLDGLRNLGAAAAMIEDKALSEAVREQYPAGIDAVLDLVGNTTLLDSMKMVRRGGRVCMAGFLGGGAIAGFDPLTQMPSGVQFSFFASFMFGTPGFDLGDVPLQGLVERAELGKYKSKPAKVFGFEDIQAGHRLMEANEANGKLVVAL